MANCNILLMVLPIAAMVLASCEATPFARKYMLAKNPDRLHRGLDTARPTLHVAKQAWESVPRGGDSTSTVAAPATKSFANMLVDAVNGLKDYMQGPKSDTLLLLLTTALNTPLCMMMGTSPILGFLTLGIIAGPNGFGLIKDIHTTEMMADLGIVFFLFEMGIHLNFDTLMSMRKDVFGLGLSQFTVTALVVAGIAAYFGQSSAAMVILGGGLALSSSAFVLQLLKDSDSMGTQYGKSSFGVLLLQDLAVVPLLVITPILAGGADESLATALGSALVKAALALGTIAFAGRFLLNPFFKTVEKAKNQEAFLGAILSTVLAMSFLTEGLGLSNTLGAFLAGVLLSETDYKHEIEKEISPFRGILVGLFFFTVGFEIDLNLIASKPALIASIVLGTVVIKAVIATSLALAFGLSKGTAQQVGLILSQGGEFAFVAFRLARSFGILDDDTTKLMLTCVSLTMGITPFLEELGARMAKKLDEEDSKKVE